MYATTTLQEVLQAMGRCMDLNLSITSPDQKPVPFVVKQLEWINVMRVIDKMTNFKLRNRTFSKLLPMLQQLRDGQNGVKDAKSGLVAYNLQDWRKVYGLIHALGDWFTMAHNQPPIAVYNPEAVKAMSLHLSSHEAKKLPVIITMTSCKRLDLLSRTIDSMLQNVLDLTSFVREWIIIDDNSSAADRAEMRELYPFVTFVMKTPEEKGHPKSMNMLRELLIKTDAKYNLHVEDDWEFWWPEEFIGRCISVLKACNAGGNVGQCLFNFEYTEDQNSAQKIWNRDMYYTAVTQAEEGGKKTKSPPVRYFIHEYYTGQRLEIENNHLGAASSMYWPHFSFRPGLTLIDVYRKIGAFDETASHFEMEYAHRYVAGKYKTAMLDCCYSTHIGRRTYERNTDKLNAYDLNKEQQFGEKPKDKAAVAKPPAAQERPTGPQQHEMDKIRTFVINLERRPNRLIEFLRQNNQELPSFEVFKGVDGSKLEPNLQIQKIFETGDYHFRRGIVGCAYSHLKIWSEFLHDTSTYCVVLEDDVRVVNKYKEKLVDLLTTYRGQFDVMMLHWNPYPQAAQTAQEYLEEYRGAEAELWSVDKSSRLNMGSGAAYVLTRRAARSLLYWVNQHGMPNAVDWVLMKQPGLRVMYSKPMLVHATAWQNSTATVQTDIQQDYNCVRFASELEMVMAEVKRWQQILHTTGVCYVDVSVENEWTSAGGFADSNSMSLIAVSKEYETSADWKNLKRRVVFVPSTYIVPKWLPVKWYTVGASVGAGTYAFKIIVPDVLLTKKVYNQIVWFNNRLNFTSV